MARGVVLFAGPPCAGKTTILNRAAEEDVKAEIEKELGAKLDIHSEFLDPAWRKLFYGKHRERYAGGFEISNLIGRIGRYNLADEHEGFVWIDRGAIEGLEAFAMKTNQDGYMDDVQFGLFCQLLTHEFDRLGRYRAQGWLESLVVNIQADNETLLARNEKRSAEHPDIELIPPAYLCQINKRYAWMANHLEEIYKKHKVPVPERLDIPTEDMNDGTGFLDKTIEKVLRKMKDMRMYGDDK